MPLHLSLSISLRLSTWWLIVPPSFFLLFFSVCLFLMGDANVVDDTVIFGTSLLVFTVVLCLPCVKKDTCYLLCCIHLNFEFFRFAGGSKKSSYVWRRKKKHSKVHISSPLLHLINMISNVFNRFLWFLQRHIKKTHSNTYRSLNLFLFTEYCSRNNL